MIINIIKKYQLRIYLSQVEKRNGVCSKIFNEDSHILLWDFDHIRIDRLIRSLTYIQSKYELSTIYILKTSISGYHAYCFTKKSLREAIHILSDTAGIDDAYLRLGMVRGYYTLRFSSRRDGKPKLIKALQSDIPANASPLDVTINEYYTSNKGVKNGSKIEKKKK